MLILDQDSFPLWLTDRFEWWLIWKSSWNSRVESMSQIFRPPFCIFPRISKKKSFPETRYSAENFCNFASKNLQSICKIVSFEGGGRTKTRNRSVLHFGRNSGKTGFFGHRPILSFNNSGYIQDIAKQKNFALSYPWLSTGSRIIIIG